MHDHITYIKTVSPETKPWASPLAYSRLCSPVRLCPGPGGFSSGVTQRREWCSHVEFCVGCLPMLCAR